MSGGATARMIVAGVVTLTCAYGCAKKLGQETSAARAAASQASATQSPNHSTQSQAVRAYIDPVTGELRDPTSEELAAEAAAQAARKQSAAANPQSEQPQQREVVLPSGAVEITLDKSSQHPLLACVQKNGDIKMDHECEPATNGAKR